MRKYLFYFLLLAGCFFSYAVKAQTAFIAEDLVVFSTVGNADSSSMIVLLEYDTTGTLLLRDTLKYSGSDSIITALGKGNTEGLMTLDSEQLRLIIPGYDTVLNIANVNTIANVRRTLFSVLKSGLSTVNSIVNETSALNGNSLRSATAAGNKFYTVGSGSGSSAGVQLMGGATSAQISGTVNSANIIQTINGILYFSTSGASPGTNGIYQVGNNPVSGPVTATITASSPAPYGFAISPDGKTMYVADSINGISKYSRSSGTASFTATYIVNSVSCTGMTVDFSSNPYTIFATTFGSPNNNLVKLKDNGAGTAYTNLTAAPAGYSLKGVTFTPGPYAKIKGGYKHLCSGDEDTLKFFGNPGDTIVYNINGVGSYSVLLNSMGTDTLIIHLSDVGIIDSTYKYSIDTIKTSLGAFNVSSDFFSRVSDTVSSSTLVSITGSNTICVGSPATFSEIEAGGTWALGNANASFIDSVGSPIVISGIIPGSDTIFYSRTNVCGLIKAIKIIHIDPSGGIAPITGASVVCTGALITLHDVTPAGTWTVTNNKLIISDSVIEGVSVGLDTVIYTTVSICGTFQATYSVTINQSPSAGTILGTNNLCSGTAFSFSVTGATSAGTWAASNLSASVSPTGIVTGLAAGVDTIKYIVSNSCGTAVAVYQMTVNPTPNVTGYFNQPVCNSALSVAEVFTSTVTGAVISWNNTNIATGLAAEGEYSISPFEAINSGTTPVSSIVTLIPSTSFCTGSSQSFTITVNPTPSVTSVSSYTVCRGSFVDSNILTGAFTGTTINWSNNNPLIGFGTSGTDTIPSYNAINTGSVTAVARIILDPVANSCHGLPDTFNITVNPVAVLTAVTSSGYCNDSLFPGVAFTTNIPGASISWTNSNPSIGIESEGVGSISPSAVYNNGDTIANAIIAVTPAFGICPGTSHSFTISVFPTPKISPINNQAICNGTNSTAIAIYDSVAGTINNWVNSNPAIGIGTVSGTGTVPSFLAANTGSVTAVSVFTVTPAANTCTGIAQVFTISVIPTPVVDPVGNLSVCNDTSYSSIVFTGIDTGVTYNWTNTNPAMGIAASGVDSIPVFSAVNGTYSVMYAFITVSPVIGSCPGNSVTFTITANPTPSVTTVINSSVCNDMVLNSIVFSGPVPGSTYNWTNSNTAVGFPGSGTDSIAAFTGSAPGVVTSVANVTVTPVINGCYGTPFNFSITAFPTPTITGVGNQVWCNGDTTNAIHFLSSLEATIYQWVDNDSVIGLSASGLDSVGRFRVYDTSLFTINDVFTVTPMANGCPGVAINFTITANPTPSVTPVNSLPLCSSLTQASIIFTGAPSTAVYNWTNSDTTLGFHSSGVDSIPSFVVVDTGVTPAVAVVTVTPFANGCYGAAYVFSVTANPTPSVSTVDNQSWCNGNNTNPVNFTGNVTVAVYNWVNNDSVIGMSSAAGSGNIDGFHVYDTGSTTLYDVFTVTPVAYNCPGTAINFTITANPTPSVTPVNSLPLCSSLTQASIIFTGTPSTAVYNWTNSDTTLGFHSSGVDSIPSFVVVDTGITPAVAVVTVTPFANGCYGAAYVFSVTANPTPVVSIVENQTKCNGDTINTIHFFSSVASASYNWVNNDSVIGLRASGLDSVGRFRVYDTTLFTINDIFTVTPVAYNCPGTAIHFTITANPTPHADSVHNLSLCSSNSQASILFTGTPSTAIYNWTNSDTTLGFHSSGVDSIPAFVVVDTGITPAVAVVTVTPFANGCYGAADIFTVTANRTPTVSPVTGAPYCNGVATTKIIFTGSVNNTTYNWSNPDTSIGIGFIGQDSIPSFIAKDTSSTILADVFTVTPVNRGCPGNAETFTITVSPTVFAGSITGISSVCVNAVITLTDNTNNVPGTWGATNSNVLVSSGVVTGQAAGLDTITFKVENTCDTNIAKFTVQVDSLPNAGTISGLAHVCLYSSITLKDTTANSPGIWRLTDTNAVLTGGILTGKIPGGDTVRYIVTNTCGMDSVSKFIAIDSLPHLDSIHGQNQLCIGALVTLTDSVGGGTWATANASIATVNSTGVLSVKTAGNTIIKYALGPDENGCYDTATFALSALAAAPFTVTEDSIAIPCYNGQGTVSLVITSGSGAYYYLWSNRDTTSSIKVSANTVYTVTVTDKNTFCSETKKYSLSQPDSITVVAVIKAETCKNQDGELTLTVSGGAGNYTYLWENYSGGNNSNSLTAIAAGNYAVKITDQNLCVVTDSFTVGDTCSFVIVHNALTPNGDGVNDEWVIDGILDYPNNEVKVFDKWGSLVYSKTGYSNTWNADGIPAGTYYYMIKLNGSGPQDTKDLLTGYIYITR